MAWRYSLLTIVLIFTTSIIVLYGFWDGITDMVHLWARKEEYGYAYFIPFITAYLIWQRRNTLTLIEFNSSWIGVAIIVSGGLLFFVGTIATTFTLVQYALILTIIGFVYAYLGTQAIKTILGPLLLLFFIIPLPPFIYNSLSGELQLISSKLGVYVIRMFGISVYLEGNVIDLGNYKLQVVEACNGLRYLFPLATLAFLAAYLYRVELWKRVVVFLSSIPITVLMNSFRIGVIGILVDNWGQEHADGFLHYFEGWVVFMSCLLILLIEMTLLAKIGSPNRKLKDVFGLEMPKPLPEGITYHIRPISSVHYAILITVSMIATSSLYVKNQQQILPDRENFSSFPSQIGNWQGDEDLLEEKYLKSLKLDDYIIGDYTNQLGSLVNFYIAYYASQQAGSAAHSPRSCIPGGGWKIDAVTEVSITGLDINHTPLTVNRLVIMKGDVKQLVYYWFQQRGRVITNEWLVKWYLFLDGFTMHRTDGALVRLTTTIRDGEDWIDGDKRLVEFAGKVAPILVDYIPN
ncbi:MAG: VPLPA-CTERM-specific exosortase XrtD [Candidatus Thiodiazotropha lotti]|nr:VPLPA-CTERM-specific exosortase XrtD [Candidatus Thiodiazotropha lotti]MCG7923573.1 VPLPA-CTERM-specific exosortase XrtD [Candidatus Thiodiazotropha lotti]MCG7929566.1 VPLPA-CTERM-specific exosortase XrtD [Candidatus Thiodiazotropha lotti]MCG7989092.1 VPLPA-CTERM-specific exosortase XrtD [Candidatus Thiodiazotropha lotti]MCG8005291.1 VPLPA-CTERM-specific exosortase XrtD [Candidatus Thiodiazotropha lotti]